jgi:hypothetical protein
MMMHCNIESALSVPLFHSGEGQGRIDAAQQNCLAAWCINSYYSTKSRRKH